MKNVMILTAFLMAAPLLKAQELKTQKDSLSYAIGVLWAENLQQQGLTDLNTEIMRNAFTSVLNGEEAIIENETVNKLFRKRMNEIKSAQEKLARKEGDDFLKENAEREGVITLESGLQYEIIREGSGPIPTAKDKVNVHYQGTLINGDIFDSSIQRGEPITFPVTGVIKGWVEALQLMPVGSKWKLFIPSDLAYGARGAGGKIGPHAALIFEVELLGIE